MNEIEFCVRAHGRNILWQLGRQEEGVILLTMSNFYTDILFVKAMQPCTGDFSYFS